MSVRLTWNPAEHGQWPPQDEELAREELFQGPKRDRVWVDAVEAEREDANT